MLSWASLEWRRRVFLEAIIMTWLSVGNWLILFCIYFCISYICIYFSFYNLCVFHCFSLTSFFPYQSLCPFYLYEIWLAICLCISLPHSEKREASNQFSICWLSDFIECSFTLVHVIRTLYMGQFQRTVSKCHLLHGV